MDNENPSGCSPVNDVRRFCHSTRLIVTVRLTNAPLTAFGDDMRRVKRETEDGTDYIIPTESLFTTGFFASITPQPKKPG